MLFAEAMLLVRKMKGLPNNLGVVLFLVSVLHPQNGCARPHGDGHSQDSVRPTSRVYSRPRTARSSINEWQVARPLPEYPAPLSKNHSQERKRTQSDSYLVKPAITLTPLHGVRTQQIPLSSSSPTDSSNHGDGPGDASTHPLDATAIPLADGARNATGLLNNTKLSSKRDRQNRPCALYPRTRTLALPNCTAATVDVGYCIGLCASRDRPGEIPVEVEGVITFPSTTKCSCCRATYARRNVTMQCLSNDGIHHLTTLTLTVSVISSCHCATSRCAGGRRIQSSGASQ
eukprot:scpid51651/ scgid18763/ 